MGVTCSLTTKGKNARLEDEISSKEKEIQDLKETIDVLKEKEKSFRTTEYENMSIQSILPMPLFPKTPFTENESDKRIMIEVGNLQRRVVNLENRLSESQQKQSYASIESKSSQVSEKVRRNHVIQNQMKPKDPDLRKKIKRTL